MYPITPAILALTLHLATLKTIAFDIPPNLQSLYQNHTSGTCPSPLSPSFTDGQSSTADVTYCGDIPSIIYLKGPDGEYADMDIDCDGANHSEGKCADDPSGQDELAFDDTLAGYGVGIQTLDAHVHPYVVFGNGGGDVSFDPEGSGVRPLSVMAVVCGGQLVSWLPLPLICFPSSISVASISSSLETFHRRNPDLSIHESKLLLTIPSLALRYMGRRQWGDFHRRSLSLSMAQLCFGDDAVDANNGYTDHNVLYIAFQGESAVPGAQGAKWNAATKEEFEDSISGLGNRLVGGL